MRKGFLDWLAADGADIVCLQETKAVEEQLAPADLDGVRALGYQFHWHSAVRKGYSGVATLCRIAPLFVSRGVPFERDEGRVLVTEHGDFTLYNAYFPNGRQRPDGPDPERLAFKLEFYSSLLELLEEEKRQGKNLLVTGDWNTAHAAVDLARPNENENVTGFLPVERRALDEYVGRGWVDTFRHFKPAASYQGLVPEGRDYTWWSYRGGARDRNVGWRLDYHFVNAEFLDAVSSASIEDSVMGSDHCPISVELDI